eukprot:8617688-Heterocapsa_arctica.AAC.1
MAKEQDPGRRDRHRPREPRKLAREAKAGLKEVKEKAISIGRPGKTAHPEVGAQPRTGKKAAGVKDNRSAQAISRRK